MTAEKIGKLADQLTATHLSRWRGVASRRRRRAARKLAAMRTPAATEALASAVVATTDDRLAAIAYGAFAAVSDQPTIDALCRVWQDTCDPGLGELIARHGWLATGPVELVALTAIRGGHAEVVAGAGPDLARALVVLADAQPPPPLPAGLAEMNPWYAGSRAEQAQRRDLARTSLAGLVRQDARDVVCELAVEGGSVAALETALSAGFVPAEPEHRAVLLFLAGEFDRYAELDFDGSLLRAAHAAADRGVRDRLARQARAAGRVDWLRAVVVEHDRRTDPLTDDEWAASLELLTGTGRWDELWRLTLSAPPRWSVRMLRALAAEKWLPVEESERAWYAELSALAVRCPDVVPSGTVFDPTDLDGPPYSGPTRPRLALSQCGKLVALSGFGGTGDKTAEVMVWRLPSGEPFAHLTGLPVDIVGLAVTSDGYLAVAGEGEYRTLRLSRLPGDEDVQTSYAGAGPLAVTPDGSLLAFATGRTWGEVSVLRLPTADDVSLFDITPPRTPLPNRPRGLRSLLVTPDGSLLVGGDPHGRVHLWRLPRGEPAGVLEGHRSDVVALAVSPDGGLLATADQVDGARLWRLPSGTPAGSVASPLGVVDLAMTPDGFLLLSAEGGGDDARIRLRRLPSGTDAGVLVARSPVHGLTVTPDGSTIVVAHTGRLTLWRSALHHLARTWVGRIAPAEVGRCRAADGEQPAERAWLDLIDGLVRWRHRHDIEAGDAVSSAAATDIEADE